MSNKCNSLDYLTKTHNNSNLTPALNQGVYFKKKQEKHSTYLDENNIKEGFTGRARNNTVPPENELATQTEEVITENNFSSTESQARLASLKEQYNEATVKFQDLSAKVNTSANNYVDRVNGNPYLGQNIHFTNGTICYVTQQGIAKPYTDWNLYLETAGRNGCPPNKVTNVSMPFPGGAPGTHIPELNLVIGTIMTRGQSCGNEGKNVYVNAPLDDFSSNSDSYMGCFSDVDRTGEDIMFVPRIGTSNSASGFTSSASSIFQNNNNAWGPWAAFDGNINSWWHSETNRYNRSTGEYTGPHNTQYIDGTGQRFDGRGEWLQIYSDVAYVLTKYDVQGRQGCCGDATTNGRSPNSWVILGFTSGQGVGWELIDRRENQSLGYGMRSYYITNPSKKYKHFLFLTTNCGDPANRTNHRTCVQISIWNLYTNTVFTSTKTAMTNANIGFVDFDTCRNHAMRNGYEFYALQQTREDNTGQCMVSNDMASAQQFGNSPRFNMIQLWSSNTAGSRATRMTVSKDGRIILTNPADPEGQHIWTSPFIEASECAFGGYVNPSTIEASYGGNCVGQPVNIDCGRPTEQTYGTAGIVGNLNGPFRDAATANLGKNAAFSHPSMSGWKGGDPAHCCRKNVTYTYQCARGTFKNGSVPGTNATFDCSKEVASCKFALALQTDGNMCIYKDDGTWAGIWCTMTNGQQKDDNPAWRASEGPLRSSVMRTGQVLNVNQWIGNDSGSIRLIMQSDGNLVLYTSESIVSCRRTNERDYGLDLMNALYRFVPTALMENIGKLGFVDGDNVLYEYPNDNAKLTNKYTKVADTDSAGHDIPGAAFGGATLEQCQTTCDNSNDCYGFGFYNGHNICFPKTKTMYPYGGQSRPLKGFDLYVRKKEPITTPIGISSDVADIDTVKYARYNKTTTLKDQYGLPKTTYEGEKDLNTLYNKMQGLAGDLGNFTTKFGQGTNEMDVQSERNIQGLKKYNTEREEITKEISNLSANSYTPPDDPFENYQKRQQQAQQKNIMNAEGFTARNDLNLILENSDIVVLQKNYEYMFWSILAAGTVLVAMNIAPNRN